MAVREGRALAGRRSPTNEVRALLVAPGRTLEVEALTIRVCDAHVKEHAAHASRASEGTSWPR